MIQDNEDSAERLSRILDTFLEEIEEYDETKHSGIVDDGMFSIGLHPFYDMTSSRDYKTYISITIN